MEDKGFNIKDVFPLIPKPIRNMQNMFSFSIMQKEIHSPQKSPSSTNKGFWRQIGDKTDVSTDDTRRNEGIVHGNSKMELFNKNKNNNLEQHNIIRPQILESPQNTDHNRANTFRASALALFGGNADFGRKIVSSNNKSNLQPLNIDNKVRRQEHLNAVINMYMNKSSNLPLINERFTGSFTGKGNRQYVNFNADDATWGNKKHDKRNDYNHKHNNMR